MDKVGFLYVRKLRGLWYVLKGNRRLFVLKKMKTFGLIPGTVAVRFYRGYKRSTFREGEPLRLRGKHDFGAELDALLLNDVIDDERSEDSGYGRVKDRSVCVDVKRYSDVYIYLRWVDLQ